MRNQEVNFYAYVDPTTGVGQTDFKVNALIRDARVLVNGIKIHKSEFEVHPGNIETVVKLLTPASKDDWISIEF